MLAAGMGEVLSFLLGVIPAAAAQAQPDVMPALAIGKDIEATWVTAGAEFCNLAGFGSLLAEAEKLTVEISLTDEGGPLALYLDKNHVPNLKPNDRFGFAAQQTGRSRTIEKQS